MSVPVCDPAVMMPSDVLASGGIHIGKLFSCEVCGKIFGRKRYLEDHLRTHTGEKPYTCPECNKAFSRNFALKRHIRLVHQPHEPIKTNPDETSQRKA